MNCRRQTTNTRRANEDQETFTWREIYEGCRQTRRLDTVCRPWLNLHSSCPERVFRAHCHVCPSYCGRWCSPKRWWRCDHRRSSVYCVRRWVRWSATHIEHNTWSRDRMIAPSSARDRRRRAIEGFGKARVQRIEHMTTSSFRSADAKDIQTNSAWWPHFIEGTYIVQKAHTPTADLRKMFSEGLIEMRGSPQDGDTLCVQAQINSWQNKKFPSRCTASPLLNHIDTSSALKSNKTFAGITKVWFRATWPAAVASCKHNGRNQLRQHPLLTSRVRHGKGAWSTHRQPLSQLTTAPTGCSKQLQRRLPFVNTRHDFLTTSQHQWTSTHRISTHFFMLSKTIKRHILEWIRNCNAQKKQMIESQDTSYSPSKPNVICNKNVTLGMTRSCRAPAACT